MRTFCLLAAVALIPAAHADTASDVMAEVTRCSDIAAAVERLDCYDKAAQAAKMATVGMPAPVRRTEQTTQPDDGKRFGLAPGPVTRPEDFGKPAAPPPDAPQEVTEISSNVLELAKNAYGRSVFVLANGQVWKQIEGDVTEVRDPGRDETMKVTIEKGLFGSYSLSIDGRRGIVKVRRVK